MPIERWATFAVNDHKRERAFVADVLLYDKLIIPVPPPDDAKEIDRWMSNDWSPAWLTGLMEILGDFVEPVRWDQAQKDEFADRWKAAKQAGRDAAGDAYGLTRRMLQQQYARQRDNAGAPVRPVVAFLTEAEMKQAVQGDVRTRAERLGVVFKHEFFCPESSIESHTAQLHYAVDLAREPAYMRARRALYDWQEDVAAKGYTDEEAIATMKDLLEDFRKAQSKGKWRPMKRFGFFALALAVPGAKELGLVSAGFALAAASGIKLVEWALGSDREPDKPGLEAAAAIHLATEELRLTA